MRCVIVVPHYGSIEHLARLLPSLKCENFSLADIQKEEKTVLPVPYGWVYIHNNNKRNLGFTRANNEGMRFALGVGADFVWLLNNDTEVLDIEAAINDLSAEFGDNPDTGVVGFKILAMDDPDFIHHAGTGACVPAGVHKVGRVSAGHYEKKSTERWVTGASLAISRNCLVDVGILDRNMVNYASDSDYCYRARAQGYRVVYLPIPVLHKIGQSSAPSPEQQKVLRSDMLYFQAKWIYGKVFFDLDREQFNDN